MNVSIVSPKLLVSKKAENSISSMLIVLHISEDFNEQLLFC